MISLQFGINSMTYVNLKIDIKKKKIDITGLVKQMTHRHGKHFSVSEAKCVLLIIA